MTIGGAITAMQTHGACMEADWPYDLNHVNKKPNDDCFKAAQQFKVGDFPLPCGPCLITLVPVVDLFRLINTFGSAPETI